MQWDYAVSFFIIQIPIIQYHIKNAADWIPGQGSNAQPPFASFGCVIPILTYINGHYLDLLNPHETISEYRCLRTTILLFMRLRKVSTIRLASWNRLSFVEN